MVLSSPPLSPTIDKPLQQPSKPSDAKRPNWELVKLYLPLVKSITKKTLAHFPDSIDRDSIHTIGLLGLIAASKSFNAQDKDARFGAYAAIRIRGALLDELRRLDWLPRHLRQKINRYTKTLNHWEQTLGRPLSDKEACNYLHLNKKQLYQIKQYLKPYVFISIDQPYDWDHTNSSSITNQLADHNQQTGIDAYEQKELYELLHHTVSQLPEKMQYMFQLHYQQGLHWSQIATMFQLSKSRICQMHTLMIQMIRKNLIKHLYTN